MSGSDLRNAGVDVGLPHIHQQHFVAGLLQPAAEKASHGARAHYHYFHRGSSSFIASAQAVYPIMDNGSVLCASAACLITPPAVFQDCHGLDDFGL